MAVTGSAVDDASAAGTDIFRDAAFAISGQKYADVAAVDERDTAFAGSTIADPCACVDAKGAVRVEVGHDRAAGRGALTCIFAALAGVAVVGTLFVAYFATSVLGAILTLAGMLGLVLAGLVASDDPDAYRFLPNRLDERALFLGGLGLVAVGLLLVSLG